LLPLTKIEPVKNIIENIIAEAKQVLAKTPELV
jgi:hypothetical protein